MAQRKALSNAFATKYRHSARPEKSAILDAVCKTTGWTRDHARARLREAGTLRVASPRVRRVVYDDVVVEALVVCWKVSRYAAGKRLAPMLVNLVPALRRDGEITCSDAHAGLLMAMSPATIDRRLKVYRDELGLPVRSHTKPGSLLRSQIPVRTWADWNELVPGFVEIDLVGHEGGISFGEFCFTLTMTDIATGWTLNRSVPNKASVHVLGAIEHLVARFPFTIRGIDSDNGSEFINADLYRYCLANEITFTRSRAHNSNDSAHVEQKNWTHVRGLVGYLRYDTPAELRMLNRIWEANNVFTNYLLTQQKLISRERVGPKVHKRHDSARTPLQRLEESKVISGSRIAPLKRRARQLSPGRLQRDIDRLALELQAYAMTKAPKPIRRINRSFNARHEPEIFDEATKRRSRRV